jgi:hypothetical protein
MRRSRMMLRTLSDRTTVTRRQYRPPGQVACAGAGGLTFVFAYVLERKGEAGVFALDDAHLAEGALSDDAQQAEVVEVHCGAG